MVVDIFIKSFNRPYYLERCINSIYKFVEGDFQIKILDDGTAPEYLSKITSLFPEVLVFKSPLYEQKWEAIQKHIKCGEKYDQYTIPSTFWYEHISNSSGYFLLLEDDIWITNRISISQICQIMKEANLIKVKIGWQGSTRVNQGKIRLLSAGVEEIKPSITFKNEIILKNRFKSASLLNILRLSNLSFISLLPFYSIYAVASCIFEKNYWLYLWKNAGEKVDESYQLKKALHWFNNGNYRYGKLQVESAKTSYITSTTNSFHDVNIDMLRFNYHLNEAWLKGDLNSMQNFPKDFGFDYFKSLLEKANDNKCTFEAWLEWSGRFKSVYQNIGCQVD